MLKWMKTGYVLKNSLLCLSLSMTTYQENECKDSNKWYLNKILSMDTIFCVILWTISTGQALFFFIALINQ